MNRAQVRPMERRDSAQVAHLTRQLGYEVTEAETEQRIAGLADSSVALVAELGDQIVGWIQGLNRQLLIYPRILEVGGLVVAEQQRGRGVGTALLAALTDWGREHGHTLMFVRSSVVREGAHGFYEGLGFEREKTSHTFSLEIV